jgi:predicted transcriptional regulator
MKTKFQQPFRDLMPPPSQEDVRLLNADIAAHGVCERILISADGEILSGHRRYEADPEAQVEVIEESKDWTSTEKKAFVLKSNTLRRNLDADGKKYVLNQQKLVARELKGEGKKQAEIAKLLGVSQQTVSLWLSAPTKGADKLIHTNTGMNQSRQLATSKQVSEAQNRLASGESQRQVAKDLGLSQPTVSRIASGQTTGKESQQLSKPRIEGELSARRIADEPLQPRSLPTAVDEILKLMRNMEEGLSIEDYERIIEVAQQCVNRQILQDKSSRRKRRQQ